MNRYEAIQQQAADFPITQLCEVLKVSRSGYYDWCQRKPSVHQQKDDQLTHRIREIWQSNCHCYGSPRIHAILRQEGYRIGRKRVARLMRETGIRPKCHKRRVSRTTIANPAHPVFANRLDRDFQATRPDEKWIVDLTYIDTHQGWLYLAGVMDLFSRRVVGIAMGNHMTTDLVEAALHMAVVGCQS